jgi:hypothetical protein
VHFERGFAGDKYMRPERRIEAYRSVIAPIQNYLYGSAGEQPGDPHKAALAMIAVVESASHHSACCLVQMPTASGKRKPRSGSRSSSNGATLE